MKKLAFITAALIFASGCSGTSGPQLNQNSASGTTGTTAKFLVTSENEGCVKCHAGLTSSIVLQWQGSKHGEKGVGCLSCHKTSETAPDAFKHNGAIIHTIVTPKDCAQCHKEITDEFTASYHATAGEILGSLDNVLGEMVEGLPAATNGCKQCHGSQVVLVKDSSGNTKKDENGKPFIDTTTWPNTGIGRINLDGSKGTCSSCHSRHSFSRKLAREPENCGKCHMGPDHPQIEIFNESKHGIAYRSMSAYMNMDSDSWVVGKDYSDAPTCATCHMSATKTLPVTHDVGKRISWTLRPVISVKKDNADAKRDAMKNVCSSCHTTDFTDTFYKQYESAIGLYNDKFAKPAKAVMDGLRSANKLTPTDFDENIEWVYYELWHHEGRRARMGASMMGPDYTQWHGFYEVAKAFYTEFLPEAKELAKGTPVETQINDILKSDDHKWLQGLSNEEKEKIRQFYKDRYGTSL